MIPRLMTVATLAAAVTAAPLGAQTAEHLQSAAAAITPAAIAQHVGVLVHDSMRERNTPSRELERTAQYVADQFAQLGLQPGGDPISRSGQRTDASWFSRYPIPGNRQLDYAATMLKLKATDKAKTVVLDFGAVARFAVDTIPEFGMHGKRRYDYRPAFVVAGPHTRASVQQANLQSRIVFYVPSSGTDLTTQRQVIDLLRSSNNVLILSAEDSATFTARRDSALRKPAIVMDRYMEEAWGISGWAVYVWPNAIKEFLTAAGLDLAWARAMTTPVVRELPPTMLVFDPKREVPRDTATAVNVVGILDGSGPPTQVRSDFGDYKMQEYIVVAAHMDDVGVAAGRGDRIRRAADDNASGIAGLIELARAFNQPGARPRRSIAFVGLSGSAKGFWGSMHWAAGRRVALVAGINLDMIGREAGDSLWIDGLPDFEFAVRPDWIARFHPELQLTLVDGGSVVNTKSDHWAFVRRWLPTLYFYNGSHDAAGPDDRPATIDAEQQARILRLIFYITHELAQAERAPQWTAEGRQRVGRALGR